MSLIGKYYCSEINSNFVVEKANDLNGQGSRFIEIDGIKIPVNIHYHFQNNSSPITNLCLAGYADDPNEYVGGAGTTNNTSYSTIKLAGGYPTNTDVNTFEGTYHRK